MSENNELYNEPRPIKVKKAKAPPRAVLIDEDQHRHQVLNGRETWWQIDCPACVKADRTRKPLPVSELVNAVFLYPNTSRHESLCREWLSKTYPNMDLNHGSALPIWQLASADECSIICVRPVAGIGEALEPGEIWEKDAFGKLVLTQNDRKKQLAQIAASEPLRVSELCELVQGSSGRIQISGKWDASELIRRIHEAFAGNFRVHVPLQKHPDEDLVVGPA